SAKTQLLREFKNSLFFQIVSTIDRTAINSFTQILFKKTKLSLRYLSSAWLAGRSIPTALSDHRTGHFLKRLYPNPQCHWTAPQVIQMFSKCWHTPLGLSSYKEYLCQF